jgi:hypothetical protein
MDLISVEMRPMFAAARAGKLIFWNRYHDLWFTPDELEAQQAAGSFRWGAVNWEIIPEDEYLNRARQRVESAQVEYDRRLKRLGRNA